MGNLCMNHLMLIYDADLAFMPACTFVNGVKKGDVTMCQVLDSFPYDGEIYLISVTGEELLNVVNRTLSEPLLKDKLPSLSDNVSVHVSGSEVVSMTIDGKDIDPNGTYTAVTNSFMMNRIMDLPKDRIIDNVGLQRWILITAFELKDPITQEMVGGDRYIFDS